MKHVLLDIMGFGGTALGITGPKMDFLKDSVSIIAGICGIIFVIYSIRHKGLEIKKMRDERKKSERPREKD